MKSPFFAKFLENQFSNEEAANVKGGGFGSSNGADPCAQGNGAVQAHNPNCPPPCPPIATLKFPCDEADNGDPCLC